MWVGDKLSATVSYVKICHVSSSHYDCNRREHKVTLASDIFSYGSPAIEHITGWYMDSQRIVIGIPDCTCVRHIGTDETLFWDRTWAWDWRLKNTLSKFAFPISRWLTSIKPSTNGESFLLLFWRLSCQERNQFYEGWSRSLYKTQTRKKCRIHARHPQVASITLGLFLPHCPVSCIPPLFLALLRMTMGYSEIVSPPGRSYHQCFCLRLLMISWVNFWNGVRRR